VIRTQKTNPFSASQDRLKRQGKPDKVDGKWILPDLRNSKNGPLPKLTLRSKLATMRLINPESNSAPSAPSALCYFPPNQAKESVAAQSSFKTTHFTVAANYDLLDAAATSHTDQGNYLCSRKRSPAAAQSVEKQNA